MICLVREVPHAVCCGQKKLIYLLLLLLGFPRGSGESTC